MNVPFGHGADEIRCLIFYFFLKIKGLDLDGREGQKWQERIYMTITCSSKNRKREIKRSKTGARFLNNCWSLPLVKPKIHWFSSSRVSSLMCSVDSGLFLLSFLNLGLVHVLFVLFFFFFFFFLLIKFWEFFWFHQSLSLHVGMGRSVGCF